MPVRMVNDDELANQEGNDSNNNSQNDSGVSRSGQGIDFGSLLRSLLNILPAIISLAQVLMQLFGKKKR